MVQVVHLDQEVLCNQAHQVIPTGQCPLSYLSVLGFQGSQAAQHTPEVPFVLSPLDSLHRHCPQHHHKLEGLFLDSPSHQDPLGVHLGQDIQDLLSIPGLDLYSLLQVYREVHNHLEVLWVLGGLWVPLVQAETDHTDLEYLAGPYLLEDLCILEDRVY